ncbi:MAG TPA: hypothetical protein VNK26_06005 [Pyrinomonadaceae bacterium]|nr:hypothetical protein [Pyrinomonadaceae bacterium]
MLKWYFHRKERHLASLGAERKTGEFDWGLKYLGIEGPDGRSPRDLLKEFSENAILNSEGFFSSALEPNFKQEKRIYPSIQQINPKSNGNGKIPGSKSLEAEFVIWESLIKTDSEENNLAEALYLKAENKKDAAVIVLPHWNAQAGSYLDLCRFLNRVGISALRLTLPYHESRRPPEINRADYLISPNIGRTLQSVRQAVIDTRTAARWLKDQGYEKIGIVGTSIGSCVAFLAFAHDKSINAAVFNHVSGYFADVVWRGISTKHVRAGLGDHITLEELRKYWMPISPLAYLDRLKNDELRPQRYIYALYDLSFPVDLSRATIKALEKESIRHSRVVFPCGHYTLGERPWVYLDGWAIINFLHRHLKRRHLKDGK